MSDELVERLLDWPYQGETMAHEAADSIKQLVATNKQLTAERDHAWAMAAKADTQMGQSLADHMQAKAERDRLREALEVCVASIEHADMSDGVCCCGEEIEGHSDPMHSGHTPVDMGEYHASLAIKNARAALKGGAT